VRWLRSRLRRGRRGEGLVKKIARVRMRRERIAIGESLSLCREVEGVGEFPEGFINFQVGVVRD
jgi:hypothetical protein